MGLLEGPFKTLRGTWKFIDLGGDMCKIEFRLEYDFSNMLLSTVISPVFNFTFPVRWSMHSSKRADRRYA